VLWLLSNLVIGVMYLESFPYSDIISATGWIAAIAFAATLATGYGIDEEADGHRG